MIRALAVALVASFLLTASSSADVSQVSKIYHYSLNYATGDIKLKDPSVQVGKTAAWDSTTVTGFFRGFDYGTAPPEETVDWGDVASGTVVKGFQFGYVTDSLTPVDLEVNFYLGNGFGDASAVLARYSFAGLPGSPGGFAGFIFDVNLSNGFGFTIAGADLDGFAGTDFEYGYIPIGPSAGAPGTGTAFGPLISTGGFGAEDVFDTYEPGAQADGAPFTGSFFFGGAPFAQFHMRLYSFIPEPGSFGLLAGLAAVVGLGYRRRRS